jgi:hypothetical protein
MTNAIIDKIQKLFGEPGQFTPENMESLIRETVEFFNELKTKLQSPDEKVREEATQVASALKTKLEEQAVALCESLGMDPKVLEAYINTPANFSTEEWQAMEKAKAELQNYKEAASKMEAGEKSPAAQKAALKKKPKAVKQWLVG